MAKKIITPGGLAMAGLHQQSLRMDQQRAQQVGREIDAILKKHNYTMVPRIVIMGNQVVEASIAIMPMPPQPEQPAPPSGNGKGTPSEVV